MKDGDRGDGSADGPIKFFKPGYCHFCGCETLIDIASNRCADCHRRKE
jgi:hypothetical protein